MAFIIALLVNWINNDLKWTDFMNYWTKSKWFSRKPFNCSMCLSFWVGVLCIPLILDSQIYLACPFCASAISVLMDEFRDIGQHWDPDE